MRYINNNEIDWVGLRLLDSSARTFIYKHNYYKAIFDSNIEFIKSLYKNGIFDEIISNGYIPITEITNLKTDEFKLLLKQQTEVFNISPDYWNPLMLKDAALTYLRFARYLNSKNLMLKDGHTWNIIFQDNSKPKWCDIGSIAPKNKDVTHFNEFIEFFVYPLLIRNKSPHLANLSRYYSKNRCTHFEAKEIIGQHIAINDKSSSYEIIDGLEKLVESIDFKWDKSLWSNYHDSMINENWDINSCTNNINIDRINLIKRLLKTIKPKLVVDIGANAGLFSILAAQLGAEVLAIEPDEVACAKCYTNVRQHNNIKVKIATANAGYKIENRADLAIALALTHHMFFTGKFRLDIIAKILSEKTNEYLITEFMPNGLGGNSPKPFPLPNEYKIEIFLDALNKYFHNVEVFNRVPTNIKSAHRIQIFAFKKRHIC